jgi:hypothetical protein
MRFKVEFEPKFNGKYCDPMCKGLVSDGVVVQKLQVNKELRRLYQTDKKTNKSMLFRALQE